MTKQEQEQVLKAIRLLLEDTRDDGRPWEEAIRILYTLAGTKPRKYPTRKITLQQAARGLI